MLLNIGVGEDSWRQEEKGTTEDDIIDQHWHYGHEFEKALGDGERQRCLACYTPWGCKKSDMTEQLKNNKSNNIGSDNKRICLPCWRPRFDSWVRKIPWRREWLTTPDSCLENPMDRGAWLIAVHSVAKSRTQLKRRRTHTCTAYIFDFTFLGVV